MYQCVFSSPAKEEYTWSELNTEKPQKKEGTCCTGGEVA